MTPWMIGTVSGASVWDGIKKIGFTRTVALALVLYLMSLLNGYVGGDLKAEIAVQNKVVPKLEDMDRRLQAQTQELDDIKRLLKMLANLGVEQCINGSEVADRPRTNCAAIAGGKKPWVE